MMTFSPYPQKAMLFTLLHLEQASFSAWNVSPNPKFALRNLQGTSQGSKSLCSKRLKAFVTTPGEVNHSFPSLILYLVLPFLQHLSCDVIIDLSSSLIPPAVWDAGVLPSTQCSVHHRLETCYVLQNGLDSWLTQVIPTKSSWCENVVFRVVW